jgi:hypothetical protein
MNGLREAWDSLSDSAKHVGDAISVGAVVGWFLGLLPSLATLLTVVFLLCRVMESRMFRAILRSLTGLDIERWLGGKSNE